MKVLWALPSKPQGDLYDSYASELARSDVTVKFFYLRERMFSLGIQEARQSLIATSEQFDVILITLFPDSIEIDHDVLLNLRKMKPLVLVAFDDEIYFSWCTHYYIRYFNGVITTDSSSLNWIRDQNVNAVYAPLYNMNGLKFAGIHNKRDLEVVFIGSLHTGRRRKMIDDMVRKGVRVNCFGMGSENGRVSGDRYWEILSRSNIVLNFTESHVKSHVGRSDPSRRYVRQAKGRPFEALLCGAHVVSEKSEILRDALGKSGGVTFVDDITDCGDQIAEQLKSVQIQDRKKYSEYVVNNYGVERFLQCIAFVSSNDQKASRLDRNSQVFFSASYGGFMSKVYLSLTIQLFSKKRYGPALALLRDYHRRKFYRYILTSMFC